jgi:hypothetical protein
VSKELAASQFPTLGQAEDRCGHLYFVRVIDPFAGDGFHMRLARGFLRWIDDQTVQFFAPRRAAEFGIVDFEDTDASRLVNSARQGDVVFFRSQDRDAIERVVGFCWKSPLWTERSKGDT